VRNVQKVACPTSTPVNAKAKNKAADAMILNRLDKVAL
jgi:hypothetical protein